MLIAYMSLDKLLALSVFLKPPKLLQPLPGSLCLVKLALPFTQLPVLLYLTVNKL